MYAEPNKLQLLKPDRPSPHAGFCIREVTVLSETHSFLQEEIKLLVVAGSGLIVCSPFAHETADEEVGRNDAMARNIRCEGVIPQCVSNCGDRR